jgi:hypothetical protein
MAVAAEVIAGILIALLLVATALTLFVGIMGAVFSEGFERCTRCGHSTLGLEGMAHPHGCPGTFHEHGAHIVQAAFHHAHLRHHRACSGSVGR